MGKSAGTLIGGGLGFAVGGPMGAAIGAGLGNQLIDAPAANKRAVTAQERAAAQANATQKYIYDTTRADQQPWREAGLKALSGLEKNDFMKDFTGDPGYQFRLNEGNKAINASAAARGMGNSGATLKSLARYGQDFASNEYNNAYNRAYGRLSQIAGYGVGAQQGISGAAQNYGNQVASNQLGMGNAIASANIAQANQQAGLVGSIIGAGATIYGAKK